MTAANTPVPIYLASYKVIHAGKHGQVNRIIRFFTKSQYSHSELTIGHPFQGPVVCVSSVGVEGGVRDKVMQLSPDKWDIIHLPHLTPDNVLAALQKHKGKRYDLIGCVRSVLPFVSREHPERYFCSELCAEIIGHQEPWRMHPGVLHAVELSRAQARPQ